MRLTRRALATVAGGAALAVSSLTLTACSAHRNAAFPPEARTWTSQDNGPPPAVDPQQPGPAPTGPPTSRPSRPGGRPTDPNIVADHLDVPWGLAITPDGNAIVGERPTGRLLAVTAKRGPVTTLMRVPGVDPAGDGGLLGITVAPSYDEDGLIYAYLTTKTDNRVVRFSVGGSVKPILTGIPKGATDNGGRIGFGPDGYLYVGTGDAGRPALAADPASLAGKILRITVFGTPAPGNPTSSSPVWASGFQNVLGLCWSKNRDFLATDAGSTADEVDVVHRGLDYGWPKSQGRVGAAPDLPVIAFRSGQASPGGCAIEGYGLFVGELNGRRLDGVQMSTGGHLAATAKPTLTNAYGRLRTVVAAPDGALWITTSNRDGHGRPKADDDKVLRILPPSGSTTPPV